MQIEGVIPPVPTPFDEKGEVAYDKLASNLKRWNETDLSGYLILGSNGEFLSLSEEEKLKVLEVAREAIPKGRKLFLAGTGAESTKEAIRFTKRAAMLGVDAALVITPSYFKARIKTPELVAHYKALADESPIPILIYNVPQFTGVRIEPEAVATLAEHLNIGGMKDSSGDLSTLAEYLRITPPRFQILVGSALVAYPALCLGVTGTIIALANVAPRECVLLYTLAKDGKHEEARALQLKLLPLARSVTTRFGIAGLKAAMDLVGYYGGLPRLPLLPIREEDRAIIRQELEAFGLLRKEERG